MQINREWWDGTTRKFIDNDDTTVVEFLDSSLYSRILETPAKYQGVEWDKSACPWKINSKSDFINLDYMLGYGAEYQELINIHTSPLFKERKKGYTFYLSTNGNNNTVSGSEARLFPIWLATMSRSDLDIDDSVVDAWLVKKYSDIHPIVEFDYSKIFVVPTLRGRQSGNFYEFGENLRNGWDATEWQSIGIAFYYKNTNGTNIPLGVDIVSLNNKFATPEWDTTDCFDIESFDNGLCFASYTVSGSTVRSIGLVGERVQVEGENGTYYNPSNYSSVDAAGAVQYFANREIWVNSPHESSIFEDEYYGGFISGNLRPYVRYWNSSVTFDAMAEYLKQQIAYLGFRFCADATHKSEAIDSQYFYIPEIDEKGVTTGNYYQANSAEAQALPNNDWTDDVYERTPYDGTDDEEDDDPNEYDEENETVLNENISKNIFVNMYICTNESLKHLSEYMYTEMPTGSPEDDFLTNNPLDAIVSLQLFPFALTSGTPTYLKLGKLTATYWDEIVSEHKNIIVEKQINQYIIYECGSCTYYPVYGIQDFRNYEPYCTAELELPYCGNIKIPTSVYLNHTIEVKYIIDLVTGACMALVLRDKLAYLCIPGQIGTQIPVTAIQTADLQASIMRKQTQYGESLISTARSLIGGAATTAAATAAGSPAAGVGATVSAYTGMISAFNQLEQAEFGLEHIQVPYTMHGTASPLTSYANEQYPRLIVKRPMMLPGYSPEDYGHIVGFACNITAPLSEFSGLTVCATANLDGIAATEAEKQLIRRALLEGVIL